MLCLSTHTALPETQSACGAPGLAGEPDTLLTLALDVNQLTSVPDSLGNLTALTDFAWTTTSWPQPRIGSAT